MKGVLFLEHPLGGYTDVNDEVEEEEYREAVRDRGSSLMKHPAASDP